jgi:hypothetical protein
MGCNNTERRSACTCRRHLVALASRFSTQPHKVFRAPRINDEQAVIVDYRGFSMRDPSELGKGHYRGP